MSTVAASSRVAISTHGFYFQMAIVCFAVGLIGFGPTYWMPMMRGTLSLPPILHLHAFFFYGWLLMFMRQTWLASTGEIARHRSLGLAGIALATGMCFVGIAAAVLSMRHAEALGIGPRGRAFSIVSITAAALFAALFATAIANVRKPEIHKRLLLVGTASLLQAAVGRWFVLFKAPGNLPETGGVSSPPPVFVTVMPGLLVDLLIVAGMIHDKRTQGRIHPAYWIGLVCVLSVQLLRAPLSETTAWLGVADFVYRLLS